MTKKSISRSYSKILQFLKFKDQIVTKINQLGRVISVFQMHSYVLSTDFNDLKFNTIVKIAFDAEDLCILILSKFLKDLEDLLDSLKTLNKNLKLFLLSFFYFLKKILFDRKDQNCRLTNVINQSSTRHISLYKKSIRN
jgi:hypothetical protein